MAYYHNRLGLDNSDLKSAFYLYYLYICDALSNMDEYIESSIYVQMSIQNRLFFLAALF